MKLSLFKTEGEKKKNHQKTEGEHKSTFGSQDTELCWGHILDTCGTSGQRREIGSPGSGWFYIRERHW